MKITLWHPILLSVFVPLSYLATAQNNIVIGHIDSISSKILQEKRKIWVHLPDSYLNGVYAKRAFTLIVFTQRKREVQGSMFSKIEEVIPGYVYFRLCLNDGHKYTFSKGYLPDLATFL